VTSARAVLAGVAPIPWRVRDVEQALVGRKLDAGAMARAAEIAVAEAEPLTDNAYKIALVRGVVEEVLGRVSVA
jgi:xanthine dehydrogenase YagS FAD-binding subunit